MTTTAKTIEMRPENLAEIQKFEQKIIERTRLFVTDSDYNIGELSKAINTLLCERTEDSLECNSYKAVEITNVITFICDQIGNFRNLDFLKNNSLNS